jgi:hypothetical protein
VRRSRAGIAGLLVAAVLAGCGSSEDARGLSAAESTALIRQLEGVRARAAARDPAGTRAAAIQFRRSVARLVRTGALSDATARSLRTGVQRVVRRVAFDNEGPVHTVPPGVTQTSTSTLTVPPRQAKKHEKKDKHGKGKGHGREGDE